MFPIFSILGIVNIFLIFLLSLKIHHNITLSLATAALLTILPWHILLIREHSGYVFILTIALSFSALFAQKIKTHAEKIGISLIVVSAIVFLISIIAVPQYTNVEVDLQRTYASLTKFKFSSTLFSNKIIESYRTRQSLLFQNLDFGNYFFSGHPRQRVGVKEIPKFYISLLPLTILGLIQLNSKTRWLTRWLIAAILIFSIILPIPFNDKTISSASLLILPVVFLSAFGLYSLKRYQKVFLILLITEAIFFFASFFGGYI